MRTGWWLAMSLIAVFWSATAGADDWRQPRQGPQWRSPPPAWGQTPGGAPNRGYHSGPRQQWQNDGYPTYRRDRQRWRDTPNDRHESRRRDDWHDQGRDDWRGGGHDWRDGGHDGERRRGGVVRRYDRDDRDHRDGPSRGYGPYGPYAPPPGYGYPPRGPYGDDYRRYDWD